MKGLLLKDALQWHFLKAVYKMIKLKTFHHDDYKILSVFFLKLIFYISNLCFCRWRRVSVFIKVHKNNFFNSKNTFAGNFISTSQGKVIEGRPKDVAVIPSSTYISLPCRAYKIYFWYIPGYCCIVARLHYRIYRSFFVYPSQQASAK